MIHDLKIAPEWFESVISGLKTFEVRKEDDKVFHPNDILQLREFDGNKYTGRQCIADVRFVLRGEYCRKGYCIMSIVVRDRAAYAPDIKPCPFCGGKGNLEKTGCMIYVHCDRCGSNGACIGISEDYCANDRAIELWNRRSEE